MNNYLFIGGAGFIGSSIIKSLLTLYKDSINVFVMEPIFANTSRLLGQNVTLFKGELSDYNFISELIDYKKIDTVVHLVSTMVPGSTYADYKREFETVIFPTTRIMQLCSQKGIRFVYFSSGGTVYGDRKSLTPFTEIDAKKPISYYGLSKQMIENSIQFENRVSNLQYLVLRPSNPYGYGQNLKANQGLIAVALGKILAGEPISIWGDGSSVRDYIYINDLALSVVHLLVKNVINETINLGSGIGYSVSQVMNIITDIAEEEVVLEYFPSRKTDVSNMILDNTHLKSFIDVHFLSLEQGIRSFYNDLKHSLSVHE